MVDFGKHCLHSQYSTRSIIGNSFIERYPQFVTVGIIPITVFCQIFIVYTKRPVNTFLSIHLRFNQLAIC